MTSPTAHLSATLYIEYTNNLGRECESLVEVEYTYDGTDLNITSQSASGSDYDTCTDWFQDLVYEELGEICDEAYAEWFQDYLDGQGEYKFDQMIYREAAE